MNMAVAVKIERNFPGMEDAEASDLSSVYLGQTFSDSVSLLAGKINMIDIAAGKPFMGGSGIDSFWNCTLRCHAQRHGPVLPLWCLAKRADRARLGL